MENTESRAMSDKYLTNSFADDGLIELTDDFVLPEHLDDAKKSSDAKARSDQAVGI